MAPRRCPLTGLPSGNTVLFFIYNYGCLNTGGLAGKDEVSGTFSEMETMKHSSLKRWSIIAALTIAGTTVIYLLMPVKRATPLQVKHKNENIIRDRQATKWKDLSTPSITLESLAASLPSPTPEPPVPTSTNAKEPEAAVELTEAEACAASWNLVAETPLDLLEHNIERGQFAMSQDCINAMMKHAVIPRVLSFLNKCLPADAIVTSDLEGCIAGANTLRAYVIGKLFPPAESYSAYATPVLANLLTMNFLDRKNLTAPQIDQNIAIADEIIARDPSAYGAHKAKLISMMIKESKFKSPIDDEQFDTSLNNLASFETVDDTFAIREESLLIEARDNLQKLESNLDETAESMEEAGTVQVESLAEQIGIIEQQIENGIMSEEGQPDPDLIKIPFLRLMLNGDNDALVEEADSYIASYPESPVGFYFRAQGLWRAGEQAEALVALKSAISADISNSLLLEIAKSMAGRDPSQYLNDIKFSLDE